MTQKSKKLVWAIAFCLFVACACASSDQLTPLAMGEIKSCGLNLTIVAPDRDVFRPGEELKLSTNKIGADLEYNWSTVPEQYSEYFFDQQTNEIMFTVPDFDGFLKILMQAEISGLCVEEDDFVFEVEPSVKTPMAAEENTAVEIEVTNTSPVTATSISISEPTATPTVAPTAEPSPTPEPTAIPTPTQVPLPTATLEPQLNMPVITDLQFLTGGAVRIAWSWDGELGPTQNFAVRFWSENDPRPEARYSITWTKGFSYQFSVDNTQFPIGTYKINVAVMEGTSEGEHHELVRSEDRFLFVNPPPPPPDPCPPSCP